MKLLLRENKLFIFLFIFLISFVFFWYLNDAGFFNSVSIYIFDYDSFIEMRKLSDNPFLGNGIVDYILFALNDSAYKNFDYNMIFSFQIFQLFPPLYASLSAYFFYKKYHTISQFVFYRKNDYFIEVIKNITINSFKLAISVFLVFLTFYLYLYFISDGAFALDINNPDDFPKSFLLDIFGDSFYSKKIYLYYLIDGFFKYFLVTFSFGMFGQSMVLLINNIKTVIVIPFIYFYGLTVLGFALEPFIKNYSIYISPSTIMANSDYTYIKSPLLIFMSLIPLILSIVIVKYRSNYVEI